MSISLRNQTTGILERAAGFCDIDMVLSPTSRNGIANKAVYDALAQKIEKTVTDLENYYNKSQLYNKQEVRDLIGSINTLTIEVVATLPTQDISSTTIYFVGPKAGTTSTYDEYIYVNNTWVQIGDTTIDLSNYVTSANLTTILQSYYTKTQTDNLFNDYYDKDAVDDLLDLKQNALTFDNLPTAGSSNPVTSTGIKTAISNAIVSSAGGSIIKVHHLDGGTVAGDTVTASKGSFSVSTTFDNNGDAIITGVGEIGTIQVTATNGTDIGVAFINTPSFSLYSTTISYGVNYKSWLEAGGLNPSSYSSLDEVLEDEEAIRRLFTIHASVDYLTAAIISDNNEDAIKLFNNDLCAKWISLRDYAMDTLPTNEHIATIMRDIDKYFYGEWTIMPQVPVMINNTLPYGEAFASSEWGSGYEAYKAFNKDSSSSNSGWESVAQSSIDIPSWVAYDFVNPIKIIRATFQVYANNLKQTTCDAYIEGSNDKTNWIRVSEPVIITTDSAAKDYSIEVNTNTAYRYYRLYYTKTFIKSQGGNVYFAEAKLLQFYAWDAKGNIPIMTGYNTPYGTVTESSHTVNWYGWMAFDNNNTTYWCTPANTNGYINYKFTNPTNVKYMRILVDGVYLTNYTLKASNDNSTWTTLCSGTYDSSAGHLIKEKFNNDNYYLYYQLDCTRYGQYASIKELQLYGREMKVSVPKMSNYTVPYGTVTGSPERTDTSQPLWKAFDQTDDIGSTKNITDGYFTYEFPNNVMIQKAYVLGHYNSTSYWNVSPKNIKFQYSLDGGTTWEDVSETFVYGGNSQSAIKPTMYDINADKVNSKLWRLFAIDNWGASVCTSLSALNFFGFDYSEYEWDTENPRHYIYDHGVELDEYTIRTFTGSSGTVTKDFSTITMTVSANTANGIVSTNIIDMSNYSLLRARIGKMSNSVFRLIVDDSSTIPWGASYWTASSAYSPSNSNLPNNLAIDLTNITTNQYIAFSSEQSTSGITGTSELIEFWLE